MAIDEIVKNGTMELPSPIDLIAIFLHEKISFILYHLNNNARKV